MWLIPAWAIAMYALYTFCMWWWRSASWFKNLSSNYKRENCAYRVNVLVFSCGIYVYVAWVMMTQPGFSPWEILHYFRNPTVETTFGHYPALTPLFYIFFGHSIFEEIMSVKMKASWVYHMHAIISLLLCTGAFFCPIDATAVLLMLEVTGIPLSIATIADCMGYKTIAAMGGMAFALFWLLFRLLLFTPYVIFYQYGTLLAFTKDSTELSDLIKVTMKVALNSLFVICFLNWYWGYGIYRKLMRTFQKKKKKRPAGNEEPQVNRNRWYRQIQKAMDDLNNLYLCPMWIQIDEYKTKVVRSVDEVKQKMEEYKADLVKSVDGYTTNLANSVDVYKAKVATSIDIYKTKVQGYKARMAKAKNADGNGANIQDSVDGVQKRVSSTVDQIRAVETKMQELTNNLSESDNVPASNNLRRRKSATAID